MSCNHHYKYLSLRLQVNITNRPHSAPELHSVQNQPALQEFGNSPLRRTTAEFLYLMLDIYLSLLDLDLFTEMKGCFSIEWLSQSSQTSCSEAPAHPLDFWISSGQDHSSTSGTASESLPGSYSRWRAKQMDSQQTHVETVQPGDSSLCSSTQQAASDSSSQQHTDASDPAAFSLEEEETSGYESEGGRSVSPAAASVSPSTGRRPRTAFTAEQSSSLERAFKRSAYLGAQEKVELCRRLNLSDKQIRNWFQNRRMKLKRTVQESLAHACQVKVISHMMHYSDLHSFRPAPYPSYYPAVQEELGPYTHCPSSFQYSPATAAGIPSVPVETLYQFSTLQSLPAHHSNPSVMTSYQPHHSQYYNTQ